MGNDLTYAVLDGIALRQASLPDDALDPVLRRELINAEVDRLWEEYRGDPFYRLNATLVAGPDTERLTSGSGTVPGTAVVYSAVAGTITALSATGITRSSGSFHSGALLAITFMRNAGGVVGVTNVFATVVQGGATAGIAVVEGVLPTFNPATDGVVVIVLRSSSTLSADFSPRYFDRVLSVKDNATRPTQGVFDEITDAGVFAELALSPTRSRRAAFYRRAGAIDFFVPPAGPALGIVTVEYAGRPGRYTKESEDETILIPPERNAVLIAAVTAAFAKMGALPKGATTA